MKKLTAVFVLVVITIKIGVLELESLSGKGDIQIVLLKQAPNLVQVVQVVPQISVVEKMDKLNLNYNIRLYFII